MPEQDPDGPSGPPPHPLDRTWLHPSEVAGTERTRPARRRSGRRVRDVLFMTLAGMTGAVATLGILAATGSLSDGSGTDGVARGAAGPVALGVRRMVRVSGASVVAVVIGSAFGTRRVSGVHLADGNVVTNAAALAGATTIRVVTGDGTEHPARLLGADPTSDLALLHTQVLPAVPATLAAPDTVQVGDPVVAMSGGDGSHHWVATGVVASTGGWVRDGTGRTRAGLMTTDRPLPPGAAGGPLLDRDARVVGILCGATEDGAAAIAVPVAWAREVIRQLAEHGRVVHGYLGVQVEERRGGLRVVGLDPDGPAARAGIRVGDVLVAVGGERIRSSATLVYEVQRRAPGTRVTLRIARGGREVRAAPTVAAAPAENPTGSVAGPAPTAGAHLAAAGREDGR